MTKLVIRAFTLIVSAALSVVLAQSTAGRIVGLVTDSSQAVLPGVEVKVDNLDTGASRKVSSGDEGTFTVTNLPVGRYNVTVEHAGFKRVVQGPLTLEINQAVRVDFALEPGSVSESITVRSEIPVVQTDDSSLGTVVDNRTMTQIPLNGRNFIRLGSLMAGTTQGAPGNTVQRDRQEGEALTANGQRAEYNNYLLDGADNNETLFGIALIVPSIDAIQEFKVQTGNYSAEFGRAAGAVVNVSIKSGTNAFHGAAYEFLRNDAFDAASFFTNYAGRPKNPLRFNQFGFAVGGPLVKNKLFLFGNYEGLRIRRSTLGGFLVPNSEQRAGNFAGFPTVYDPLTLVGGVRTPFPNNRIPADRIAASSRKAAEFWPLPNNPGDPSRPYIQTFNNPSDRDQFHIRGDYNANEKDQFFARVSWTDRADQAPSIAFNGESTNNKHKGGVAGWTHLFTPTMLNDAKLSATLYQFELISDGTGTDFAGQLGLPSFAPPDLRRFPPITVQSVTGLGGRDSIPLVRKENNFQFIDQFSRISGKHSLKAGFDIRWYQTNNLQPQSMDGQYTFSGAFTGPTNGTYVTGVPDFLLGFPVTQRILIPEGYDATRVRNKRMQWYLQDDYQVAQNLTLNVGFRYEYDGAWLEKNDRTSYFDYSTGELVLPRSADVKYKIPFPHRFEDNRGGRNPVHAPAPRIGFAWRPFNNNRTVIRGAYGIFWGQPTAQAVTWNMGGNPPFFLRSEYRSSNATPDLRFGAFPPLVGDNFVPVNPALTNALPTNTNSYVQQWNWTMQREVGAGIAVQAGYVGSKGTHLERRYESNAALPPGPGAINARRKYPQFLGISLSDSSSFATYHSLQIQAEKRMSGGLQFLLAYTYSKSLDDNSSFAGLGGQESFFAQDPSRLFLEKGRSGFDLRQRFTSSVVYEVPGKYQNRLVQLALGGWQLAGILTLQTGFPFTAVVGGDLPNAGTGNTRANLNGQGNLEPGSRTIDRWFNTAAFSAPAPFTFGTAGRNILDGPGMRALDGSLMKIFSITERHRLQFRAEFFNLPNHPNFGLPAATVGAANFGTIRGGGGGREIQLGLKYLF